LTDHNRKLDQMPDYDLIQVLRWFHANGDQVYVWSAGGVNYCWAVVSKLGLDRTATSSLT
jgi:hypothetical protein